MFLTLFTTVSENKTKGITTFIRSCLKATTPHQDEYMTLFDKILIDPRAIRKRLELDPRLTIYGVCPKCFFIYEPDLLPMTCQDDSAGDCCGEVVADRKVQDGISVLRPSIPFAVRDYDDFLRGLLSRPGMEALLREGSENVANNRQGPQSELRDIRDGTHLRSLKAPDGEVFMQSTLPGELRIALACSIDWFNPLHNKAGGKSVSTGVIAFTILNLPPAIRNRPENIYVAAIIPGPKEPPGEKINQYLSKVLDVFLKAWEQGSTLRRSDASELLVRTIIAVLIADLPASRKVSGTAGHSATILCPVCDLDKDKVNDLSRVWKLRTCQYHLEKANEWLEASSPARRRKLYKETGIRWSEFLRLPYWDPTTCVVIDPMHNILLGIAAYHCRVILGIQELKTADKTVPVNINEDDLDRAREKLRNHPTKQSMKTFTVPILTALCEELELHVSPSKGKRVLKDDLITALLVCLPGLESNHILTILLLPERYGVF